MKNLTWTFNMRSWNGGEVFWNIVLGRQQTVMQKYNKNKSGKKGGKVQIWIDGSLESRVLLRLHEQYDFKWTERLQDDKVFGYVSKPEMETFQKTPWYYLSRIFWYVPLLHWDTHSSERLHSNFQFVLWNRIFVGIKLLIWKRRSLWIISKSFWEQNEDVSLH